MDKLNMHTEEFNEVAKRIPDSYTSYIVYGLFIFIIILFVLGFLIDVPEKVNAEVKVTSIKPPITLNAQTNGKIHLISNQTRRVCKMGEYLAVIENAANYKDVQFLKSWTESTDIWNDNDRFDFLFEHNLILGDIEIACANFKLAYIKYHLMKSRRSEFGHQKKMIDNEISRNSQSIVTQKSLLNLYQSEKKIKEYYVKSDSILYNKKAISKDEMDKSLIDYLASEDKELSIKRDIKDLRLTNDQNNAKRNQVQDQEVAAFDEAKLHLNDAFQNLVIQIKNWEKNFVIISPTNCIVEYANVISDGTFVSAGEGIYNVICANNSYYGIAVLPSEGSGSVSVGDSVNLKMTLYPYQEYGVLRGSVKTISMNSIDGNYLIYIDLPKGLKSDNNITLSFAEAMYGNAEIITDKKKLIFKLFNKLKGYVSSSRLKENAQEKEKQQKSIKNQIYKN
jgi:hypothetical protein